MFQGEGAENDKPASGVEDLSVGGFWGIVERMKFAVLLSGGVDSSVALHRILDAGHRDVSAYYLKIWLEDELSYMGACPWEEDLEYARAVCGKAGVPLRVVSLQAEYYARVVQYAIDELKEGRTPSPDIFCNQRIKFGAFFDKVQEDYDKVASGHYALVEEWDGLYHLLRSPDPVKDQTYFLSHLDQSQLAKIALPIGGYHKDEVRRLAQGYDLANKDRKDSQGICFLGKIKYGDFVKHYLGEKPGEIVERETGKVLGEHKGFWFHTIGQRQGLGLGNGPWYVVAKDIGRNIVYISHHEHREDQERRIFVCARPHWIGMAPKDGEALHLKLRHGPDLIPCRIETGASGELTVSMERPDRGIAPGQFAVFYRDWECLGSSMISSG